MAEDKTIILDKPEQITAFAYLQVYHKLQLEVNHPNGPKWRFSPMNQAKNILEQNGKPTTKRTKKAVLAELETLLKDLKVIS